MRNIFKAISCLKKLTKINLRARSFEDEESRGIQPTGVLHLGNYLGAIQNWVGLQNKHHEDSKIIYSIVDLHALSDKFKVDHSNIYFKTNLKEDTINLAAALLAAGIDPSKAILFVQSHVPEHTELCWILSSIAPMNWLNRMTQYKDKKTQNSSLALFSYPVLQTADIILYRANQVPVGEDQIQHVELARDYAQRFNALFTQKSDPFFPNISVVKTTIPKVMSLKDANKKMSKSEESDYSRINLTDDAELIHDKIMKAKTDSIPKVNYSDLRPEVANLFRIYSVLSGKTIKQLDEKFANASIKEFKESLAGVLIAKICPIGQRIEEFLHDREAILATLRHGGEQAREIANKNLKLIKNLMGMSTFD